MRNLRGKLALRVGVAAALLTVTMMVGVETASAGDCQVCVEFDEGSGLCVGCCDWCTGWGQGGTGCIPNQEFCLCQLTGPVCYIID